MSDRVIVQSIDPAGGYPVAATYRNYSAVGTAAIQHMIIADVSSDVQANVRSYGGGKALAVALTDPQGSHMVVQSVNIVNALTVTGSLQATQAGNWVFTGSTFATQQGSWLVNAAQSGAWAIQATSGTAQLGYIGSGGQFIGLVAGSMGASQLGNWVFTGSVLATQGGAPWSFGGSVQATQQGSWRVLVDSTTVFQGGVWTAQALSGTAQLGYLGSGGQFVGFMAGSFGATQLGTWSVQATQAGNWTIQVLSGTAQLGYLGSGAQFVGFMAGSVFATQQGSWSVNISQANTLAPLTVFVASQAGGGSAVTGSVQATQAGSWRVLVDSTTVFQGGAWTTQVLSGTAQLGYIGSGGQFVGFTAGSVFATQQGSWLVNIAQVNTLAPITVFVASQAGGGSTIQGSVFATQQGSWLVNINQVNTLAPITVYVASQAGGGSTITGSVFAAQAGSWAVYVGSTAVQVLSGTAQLGYMGSGANFVGFTAGSMFATQQGSWLVNINQVNTLAPITVFVASQAGGGSTIQGSVQATQAGSWKVVIESVAVNQGTNPWVTVGSMFATQQGSWQVRVEGLFQNSTYVNSDARPALFGGVAFNPVDGLPPLVGSGSAVLGLFDRAGRQRILVDSGTIGITQTNTLAPITVFVASQAGGGSSITGSVFATQQGSWAVYVGSTAVQVLSSTAQLGYIGSGGQFLGFTAGSVGATQLGTWSVQATQAGNWTVQILSGTAQLGTITGSVLSTQQGSWQARVEGLFTNSTYVNSDARPVVIGGVALNPIDGLPPLVGSGSAVLGLFDRAGRQRVLVDTGQVSVTGSVFATQQGSWLVNINQVNTLAPITVFVASQAGGGSTITGSVWVANTPSFNVTQANTLAPLTVFVASQAGGGSAITGSVWIANTPTVAVVQANSPWISQAASSGQFVGFVAGSVFATQQGSWTKDGAIYDGANPAFRLTVSSITAAVKGLPIQIVSSGGATADVTSRVGGSALKVDIVQGTLSGANGAIVDGVDVTILSTVRSYGGGKPVAVALTDLVGSHMVVLSVNVVNAANSVFATQQGSWQARVEGLFTNSTYVNSDARPVIFGGVALNPVDGLPPLVGSGSAVLGLFDRAGRQRVLVDSGTIGITQTNTLAPITVFVASQAGGGSTITGSVFAAQAGSWAVYVGSTAAQILSGTAQLGYLGSGTQFVGFMAGSVFATQQGSWLVNINQVNTLAPITVFVASQAGGGNTIQGSVQATQAGSWRVLVDSTTVFQGGTWTFQALSGTAQLGYVGSGGQFIGFTAGSVFATQQGSWQTRIEGLFSNSTYVSSDARPTLFGGVAFNPTDGLPPLVGSGSAVLGLFDRAGRQRVLVDSGQIAITQINTATPLTVIVTSTAGGGGTSSVFAIQQGSWRVLVDSTTVFQGGVWTTQALSGTAQLGYLGSGAQFVGFMAGSVFATQQGSWTADGAIYDGANPAIRLSVSSITAAVKGLPIQIVSSGGATAAVTSLLAGSALKVDVVQGQLSGANGAIVDGIDASILATVRSYGGSKPQAVALTDPQGSHTIVLSVNVVNAANSMFATQQGSWQARVEGLFTNSTYVNSDARPLIIGGVSWNPTDGLPPLVGSGSAVLGLFDRAGRQRILIDSGQVSATGSFVATQGGTWTFQALSGTAQLGYIGSGASFIGLTTGSAFVTQQGSWLVNIAQVNTLAPITVFVASQAGGGSSITGSVFATQQGSWLVNINQVNTLAPITVFVASQAGGGNAITGSVWIANTPTVAVVQANSPWISQAASSGQFVGFMTGSFYAVQQGSWTADGAIYDGANPAFRSTVSSITSGLKALLVQLVSSGGASPAVTSINQGNALKVDIVQGQLSGANGAIVDGVDATILATVRSYGSGIKPQVVQMVSTSGALAEITSLAAGGALKVDLVNGSVSGANGAILDGSDATIIANVRSIANANPLRVEPYIPNISMRTTMITMQSSALSVVSGTQLVNRRRLTVQNPFNAGVSIFFGDSTVTNSSGLEIVPGGSFPLDVGNSVSVYGIVNSGQSQGIRVLEQS